ncbi:MAG: zinc ribbon domain-containing protein [Gemmatimonadota bacterium]
MYWEAVVAALVGIAAVVLILEPMLRAQRVSTEVIDLDEEEETPASLAVGALKEIEFDKATGKLSDSDYQLLHDKYTVIALAALRSEPEILQPAADPIEAMVADRVRHIKSGRGHETDAAMCPTCGPRPEPDAVFCSNCGGTIARAGSCGNCGCALVPDGAFCEGCGNRVAA